MTTQPPANNQTAGQPPASDLKAERTDEQIKLWEAQDNLKQGDHNRRKEIVVLTTGSLVLLALAGVGVWFALRPESSPEVRNMAAGWVGVVLGQAVKVVGGD